MPETSPLVLIIRLDAIGDALALTPMLAAFAQASVPVDIVLRAQNADVFSSRAARHIYQAPFDLRSNTDSNLAAIAAFGATLRENRYTHVLVATEDPGGYRLARAIGAPNRIGFTNGWGKPFKTLWATSMLTRTVYRSAGLDPNAPHECRVDFELARTLLGNAEPTRDARLLRPLVLEHLPGKDPRVAIQITDKWERLGIPFADVVEMTERLRAVAPARFFAASSERAYADRIMQATRIGIETFENVETWKGAIAAARALVAPDSGAVHVAGMIGTPTVAVFPPIRDFTMQTGRWSPWAAPYRIVRADPGWPLATIDALVELDSAGATGEPVQPAADERR